MIEHLERYCIPMDDDRPVARAEIEFFSHSGTGKGNCNNETSQCSSNHLTVPVVAVFTKCEALEVKAIMALEERGESYERAIEQAPKYIEENLKNTHLHLQDQQYPPKGHVYLQGVQLL